MAACPAPGHVIQKTVLPLDKSVLQQSALALDMSVIQQPACDVLGGVWSTVVYAAPGRVCLQEPYCTCTCLALELSVL
jgi:hypothetical protein